MRVLKSLDLVGDEYSGSYDDGDGGWWEVARWLGLLLAAYFPLYVGSCCSCVLLVLLWFVYLLELCGLGMFLVMPLPLGVFGWLGAVVVVLGMTGGGFLPLSIWLWFPLVFFSGYSRCSGYGSVLATLRKFGC